MTAIRSPSWTTSPSATCSRVSVPEPSARTGISIFIDSRMTRVSPSETSAPSAATTFHTFATISARTSATAAPLGCPTIVLAAGSGAQPGDDRRVVIPAAELLAGQQVGVERQVGAWPDDPERRDRLARAGQRLVPVRPVHAQLGEQWVVERGHRVPRGIPGVYPHAGADGLLPPRDGPRAGQEAHRIFGVHAQFQRMPARLDGGRIEAHILPGGDAELLLHQVDPGDQFGDRVLDLQPGVHLEEHEITGG